MGLGREAAAYMQEISQFKKGDSWGNINGVAVLEDQNTVFAGSQFFPTNPFGTYSQAIGDQLSFCFLKHARDSEARRKCQEAFYSSQASEQGMQQQQIQLAQEALRQQSESRWSAGQVALVSVLGIAAITGMVFVIKKFTK